MYVCFILLLFFLVGLKLLEERHTTHTHLPASYIVLKNTLIAVATTKTKQFSVYIFSFAVSIRLSPFWLSSIVSSRMHACPFWFLWPRWFLLHLFFFFTFNYSLATLHHIIVCIICVVYAWYGKDACIREYCHMDFTGFKNDTTTKSIYTKMCLSLRKKNTFIYGYIVSGWCRRLSEAFFFLVQTQALALSKQCQAVEAE